MSGTYINIPAIAGQNWKDAVANAAALPASGNRDGDTRVVLDSHTIYIWDGASWNASGGGGGGAVDSVNGQTGVVVLSLEKTETFTLDGTDITNKYVTLAVAPTNPDKTVLLILGAPNIVYGDYFTVTGDQLSWNGTPLDGVVASGEKFTVLYN